MINFPNLEKKNKNKRSHSQDTIILETDEEKKNKLEQAQGYKNKLKNINKFLIIYFYSEFKRKI